ncbi:unnamed protein product [Moneuplotes crassus]|uniref:Uncharacterized protein n=1 Tax=Euplotes crassus TaxID=5936 RepID=A0AAD1U4T1_EUPCR|nr:unnamed protein product [Moneuplotes crassus]
MFPTCKQPGCDSEATAFVSSKCILVCNGCAAGVYFNETVSSLPNPKIAEKSLDYASYLLGEIIEAKNQHEITQYFKDVDQQIQAMRGDLGKLQEENKIVLGEIDKVEGGELLYIKHTTGCQKFVRTITNSESYKAYQNLATSLQYQEYMRAKKQGSSSSAPNTSSSQKFKSFQTTDTLHKEVMKLRAELEQEKQQTSDLKTENETIKQQLNESQEIIQQKDEEIKKLRADELEEDKEDSDQYYEETEEEKAKKFKKIYKKIFKTSCQPDLLFDLLLCMNGDAANLMKHYVQRSLPVINKVRLNGLMWLGDNSLKNRFIRYGVAKGTNEFELSFNDSWTDINASRSDYLAYHESCVIVAGKVKKGFTLRFCKLDRKEVEEIIIGGKNCESIRFISCVLKTDEECDFGDALKDATFKELDFRSSGKNYSNWESNPHYYENIIKGISKGSPASKTNLRFVNIGNCDGFTMDQATEILKKYGFVNALVT